MNHFERPDVLFLIPLVIVFAILFYRMQFHKNKQSISLSHQGVKKESLIEKVVNYIPFLRFISLIFLLVALAGPGTKSSLLPDEKNGVDMMIAIDVSGSMVRSSDFLPKNRLEVSKELIKNFIKNRTSDRVGLAVFAGAAYLQSPLTNDLDSLVEVIEDINETSVEEQGTAVGDAITLCTYRLKNSKARSKVMVIITDGASNTGKIDPETAAETAESFKVKIYSIGIGNDSAGIESETDFDSLKQISQKTDGMFYRALDSNEFAEVLRSIDSLEKDLLNAKPKTFIESHFMYYLFPGILLFLFDLFLRAFYRKYFI